MLRDVPNVCGMVTGDLDDMPRYIKAALGQSRDWAVNAYCKDDAKGVAWRVAPSDRIPMGPHDSIYRGSELIAYAEAVCELCPAQYECARYAVRTEASIGTWGVRYELLRWLVRDSGLDPIALIDAADAEDVTVQEAVCVARRAAEVC